MKCSLGIFVWGKTPHDLHASVHAPSQTVLQSCVAPRRTAGGSSSWHRRPPAARTQRCPWRTRPSAAARALPWAPTPARRAPVPVQGLEQGLVTGLQARARWAAAAASALYHGLLQNHTVGQERQGPHEGLEVLQARLLASAPRLLLQGRCHGVLQHSVLPGMGALCGIAAFAHTIANTICYCTPKEADKHTSQWTCLAGARQSYIYICLTHVVTALELGTQSTLRTSNKQRAVRVSSLKLHTGTGPWSRCFDRKCTHSGLRRGCNSHSTPLLSNLSSSAGRRATCTNMTTCRCARPPQGGGAAPGS